MAQKIEVITQKQLVPHLNLNGIKTYKDYGMQSIFIYDTDNNPPTLLKSGMTLSGPFECAEQPENADGNRIAGEMEPIIRHNPFWRGTEEPTGIVEPS